MVKAESGDPDSYGAYYPWSRADDDVDGVTDAPADVSEFIGRNGR